jgi:hypothetical protein
MGKAMVLTGFPNYYHKRLKFLGSNSRSLFNHVLNRECQVLLFRAIGPETDRVEVHATNP